MANASGRYGSLRNRNERLRAFFKDKKRVLFLGGLLLLLLAATGAFFHFRGNRNMIALLTPTPEATASTPAPSDTPEPTITPTTLPTEPPQPTPTVTPVPTLPLYGELKVHIDEGNVWETPRQGTSAPKYSMNVRSGPGGDYEAIDTFGAGKRVTVFGKQDAWYYIWYAGKFGWAHEDLIRLDEEKTATAAIGTEAGDTLYPRLVSLPADASLYRLVFAPDCMTLDADGSCRAHLLVEQYVRFTAREVASLAVGSRLTIATMSVEVESLMWERGADGEPLCLLVNNAYRIGYDEGLASYCLVTNADGQIQKQRVAFTDLMYEIVFAKDAVVETPDALLWGGSAPAPTAAAADAIGQATLPTMEIAAADFAARLQEAPAADFPPQIVQLTFSDGLVTHMYWSFWA